MMNLGLLSYILACITVFNSLLWYLYPMKITAVMLASVATYCLWFFYFWTQADKKFNAADKVTVSRWVLFVSCVVVATMIQDTHWWILIGVSLAVALDGLDGWMARKLSVASDYGRILDMEVDHMTTSLLVALSVMIIGISPWFLGLNLLRPLYLLFGKQKLQEKEYRSKYQLLRAKLICIVSQILLIVNLAPIFSLSTKEILSFMNLLLLTYSFAIDLWLEHRHHRLEALPHH